MTNRLQIRRGTSDATAVTGTQAGEPLFNSETGQLYVSDGTDVRDVVLEGLRRTGDTWEAGISYPEHAYVRLNGETYRASRALASNYPMPGADNSGEWVRVGFTENEIRAFAANQDIVDTTTLHLDISHGTFSGDLAATDQVDLGMINGNQLFAAMVYDVVTDLITFTVASTPTINAARFAPNGGTARLISINQTDADITAETNNGNTLSIIAAEDIPARGTAAVASVRLTARPFPDARRYLQLTTGTNPAIEIDDSSSAFNDNFYRQAAAIMRLNIFTPRAEGSIVVYDADASNRNGFPTVSTIQAVDTLPANPVLGSAVLLRNSDQDHNMAFQVVPRLVIDQVSMNWQQAYHGAHTNTGAENIMQNYSAEFLDPLHPARADSNEFISSNDDAPANFGQDTAELVHDAVSETWVAIMPAGVSRYQSDGALLAQSVLSEEQLRTHFRIGDELQLSNNPGSRCNVVGFTTIANVGTGVHIPGYQTGNNAGPERIGLMKVSGRLRRSFFDESQQPGRGGFIFGNNSPRMQRVGFDLRLTFTGATGLARSIERALTRDVTDSRISGVMFTDIVGRPLFAFGPGRGTQGMLVQRDGFDRIDFLNGDNRVVAFTDFHDADFRLDFRTSNVVAATRNDNRDDLPFGNNLNLHELASNYGLEGGTATQADRPAVFMHVSTQPVGAVTWESDLTTALNHFFPPTTYFNTILDTNPVGGGTLRYLEATDAFTLQNGDVSTNFIEQQGERGAVAVNSIIRRKVDAGLRVFDGTTWR